jgi:hypothetical protein
MANPSSPVQTSPVLFSFVLPARPSDSRPSAVPVSEYNYTRVVPTLPPRLQKLQAHGAPIHNLAPSYPGEMKLVPNTYELVNAKLSSTYKRLSDYSLGRPIRCDLKPCDTSLVYTPTLDRMMSEDLKCSEELSPSDNDMKEHYPSPNLEEHFSSIGLSPIGKDIEPPYPKLSLAVFSPTIGEYNPFAEFAQQNKFSPLCSIGNLPTLRRKSGPTTRKTIYKVVYRFIPPLNNLSLPKEFQPVEITAHWNFLFRTGPPVIKPTTMFGPMHDRVKTPCDMVSHTCPRARMIQHYARFFEDITPEERIRWFFEQVGLGDYYSESWPAVSETDTDYEDYVPNEDAVSEVPSYSISDHEVPPFDDVSSIPDSIVSSIPYNYSTGDSDAASVCSSCLAEYPLNLEPHMLKMSAGIVLGAASIYGAYNLLPRAMNYANTQITARFFMNSRPSALLAHFAPEAWVFLDRYGLNVSVLTTLYYDVIIYIITGNTSLLPSISLLCAECFGIGSTVVMAIISALFTYFKNRFGPQPHADPKPSDGIPIFSTIASAISSLTGMAPKFQITQACKDMHTAALAATDASKLLEWLLNFMPKWIRLSIASYLPSGGWLYAIKDLDPEEWVASCTTNLMPNVLITARPAGPQRDLIISLATRAAEMRTRLVGFNVPASFLINLNKYSDQLYAFLATPSYSGRACPFSITLYGDPQVGKTVALDMLTRKLGLTSYSRQPENQFWDGYTQQPVVILDDWGKTTKAEDYLQEFTLVSNAEYIPQFASLNDPTIGIKGTHVSPQYVFRSTNNPFPNIVGLANVNALYERRQLLVRVFLHEGRRYFQLMHRTQPNVALNVDAMTFDEFHAYFLVQARAWFQNQANLLRQYEHVVVGPNPYQAAFELHGDAEPEPQLQPIFNVPPPSDDSSDEDDQPRYHIPPAQFQPLHLELLNPVQPQPVPILNVGYNADLGFNLNGLRVGLAQEVNLHADADPANIFVRAWNYISTFMTNHPYITGFLAVVGGLVTSYYVFKMTVGGLSTHAYSAGEESKVKQFNVKKNRKPQDAEPHGDETNAHVIRNATCNVTCMGYVDKQLYSCTLNAIGCSRMLILPYHFVAPLHRKQTDSLTFHVLRPHTVKENDEKVTKYTPFKFIVTRDDICVLGDNNCPYDVVGVRTPVGLNFRDISGYFTPSDCKQLVGSLFTKRNTHDLGITTEDKPVEATLSQIGNDTVKLQNIEYNYGGMHVLKFTGTPGKVGECGSPLVSRESTSYKLLIHGIYVWWDSQLSRGFAAPLDQTDVKAMMKYLGVVSGPSILELEAHARVGDDSRFINFIGGGQFDYVGRALFPNYQQTKTKLRKSLLFECLGPHISEPAVLKPNDPRVLTNIGSPLALAVSKMKSPANGYDPTLIDNATHIATSMFNPSGAMYHILPLDVACYGGEVGKYKYEPLDFSTSAGYGWKKMGTKRDLLFKDGEPFIEESLKHAVELRLKMAFNGERMLTIWLDCLKDERRTIGKIESNTTRTFTGSALDYNIVFRQLFLPAIAHINRHYIEVPSACGMDVASYDWHRMITKLNKFPKHFASDIQNNDGEFPLELLNAVYCVLSSFMLPENRDAAFVIWQDIVSCLHSVSDMLYFDRGSLPSGFGGTTTTNTIGNYVCLVYSILHTASERSILIEPSYIRKNLCSIFYGDDNINGVSEELSTWWNPSCWVATAATVGRKITNETKTGAPVFEHITNLYFLKHKVTFIDHLGAYGACMDEEKVIEIAYWYRHSFGCDIFECTKENAISSLRFAYFHGHHFFTKLRTAYSTIFLDLPVWSMFHIYYLAKYWGLDCNNSLLQKALSVIEGSDFNPMTNTASTYYCPAVVFQTPAAMINYISQVDGNLILLSTFAPRQYLYAPLSINLFISIVERVDKPQRLEAHMMGAVPTNADSSAIDDSVVLQPFHVQKNRSTLPDIHWTFDNIVSRDTPAKTANILSTNPANFILASMRIPYDLLPSDAVASSFRMFDLARFTANVSIQVNSTLYHSGKLIAGFIPNRPTLTYTPTINDLLNFQHSIIDLAGDSLTVMSLPFISNVSHLHIDAADPYFSFVLLVLNPLVATGSVASSIPYTVSVSYVDADFKLPSLTPNVLELAELVSHGNSSSRITNVYGNSNDVRSQDEIAQTNDVSPRVESSVAAGTGNTATTTTDEEAREDPKATAQPKAVKAKGAVTGGKKQTAHDKTWTGRAGYYGGKAFDWFADKFENRDKTKNPAEATPPAAPAAGQDLVANYLDGILVQQSHLPFMGNCNNIEPVYEFRTYPGMLSECSLQDAQMSVDEMDVLYLCRKPAFLDTFSITATQVAKTKLATYYIEPTQFNVLGASYKSGFPCPWISALSAITNFWSGDLEFSFLFSSTTFQTGKIIFSFAFGDQIPTSFNQALNTYTVEYDLASQNKNITFRIPFLNQNACMTTARGKNTVAASSIGVITIWVLNPVLALPDSVATVNCSSFYRAGPNFQLAGLRADTIYARTAAGLVAHGDDLVTVGAETSTVESLFNGAYAVTSIDRIFPIASISGERIASLKDLAKRRAYVRTLALAAGAVFTLSIDDTLELIPYSYLLRPFLFKRGSVRMTLEWINPVAGTTLALYWQPPGGTFTADALLATMNVSQPSNLTSAYALPANQMNFGYTLTSLAPTLTIEIPFFFQNRTAYRFDRVFGWLHLASTAATPKVACYIGIGDDFRVMNNYACPQVTVLKYTGPVPFYPPEWA